jgi:outer membrane protein assembly factor BamB
LSSPDGNTDDGAESGDGGETEGVTDDDGTGSDGWAQFRRDERNSGVAPEAAGPGGTPDTLWEFDLAALLDVEGATLVGPSVSSPVVVAETVVVNVASSYLVDDETGEMGVLVGLDPESGTGEWTHELSGGSVESARDPVVVDGSVVAVSLDLDASVTVLSAHDPATGEQTGDAELERFVSSMTVGSQRVFARAESDVVALDPGDWQEVWSTGTGRRGTLLDHPAVTDDRVLLSQGAEVLALDAGTGDQQWRTTFEVPGDLAYEGSPTPFADPVVVGGTAYVAGSPRTVFNRGEAGLVAFDPTSGEEQWRFTPEVEDPDDDGAVAGSAAYGYPLAVAGSLYVTGFRGVFAASDGGRFSSRDLERRLFELDPDSGAVRDEHAVDGVSIAPVAAGETLYLTESDGVATAAGGIVELEAEGSPMLSRSPAVGGGRVFVPVRGGVLALGGS